MRFKVFVLLCLCVSGCGDVVLPPQVLDIVSLSESVVIVPPEEVWDGIRLNQRIFPREAGFEAEQRAFYTKYINADGIAILAHVSVEDEHLIAARHVVLVMTAKHPALRDRLRVQHGFYLILFKHATGPGDAIGVPELFGKLGDYGTYREQSRCSVTYSLRGSQGVNGYCIAAVAQEHLGRMHTVVHEFAHALDSEIDRLVPGFLDRLEQAYQKAKASGAYRNLWDPYIITENSREYWAEGTEIWFYGIGEGREFETHEAFAEVDPLLYELLSEWFYQGSFPRTPIPGVPQYEIMWEQLNSERR